MTKTGLVALAALSIAISGCARWQPETSDPQTLPGACPLLGRAPSVAEFPAGGLRGTYQFVTQDASTEDKVAFLDKVEENGFALVPLTIDLNGKETLVAHGAAVLRRQAEVDAEFATACAMGHGAVYLTHVTHNPVDAESARVR